MISTKAMAALAAAMMIAGSSMAMAKTKTATAPVVHSPESIQCSKEADDKGLKGADRKKFRAKCIKEAKKNAASTAAKKPDEKPDDKTTDKKS